MKHRGSSEEKIMVPIVQTDEEKSFFSFFWTGGRMKLVRVISLWCVGVLHTGPLQCGDARCSHLHLNILSLERKQV